jgi:hypothetical protein
MLCKPRKRRIGFISVELAAFVLGIPLPPRVAAQAGLVGNNPLEAVSAILGAACRQNATQFATYLTPDNSAAFHSLPDNEREALMKRLSLSDDPGRPLLSADSQNRPIVRCETPGTTVEFQLGPEKVHQSLAFVPVTVVGGQATQFGLVKEDSGWKLLSVGLMLFDIPQLSKQWAAQEIEAREQAAIQTLKELADTIQRYQRIYGKLPESLAQMGPAPKGGVSPEQAQLIDSNLAAGSQNGYQYRYRIVPSPSGGDAGFELAGTPQQYGKTGRRSFFLDVEGKVHGGDKNGAVASVEDPLTSSSKDDRH